MAARQVSKSERKRQCITVPFVWEEKPGIPKKGWKPTGQQSKHTLLPVKLVVSVPFGWEEKPGTPLRSFVEPGWGFFSGVALPSTGIEFQLDGQGWMPTER